MSNITLCHECTQNSLLEDDYSINIQYRYIYGTLPTVKNNINKLPKIYKDK